MPYHTRILSLAALASLALTACDRELTAPATPSFTHTAPDSTRLYAEPHEWSGIKDQYLIRFSDGVREPRGFAEQLVRQHGGRIHYVYVNVMKGFAATLPAHVADALRRHPHVASVSPDMPILPASVQVNAPWHLDRDDQRSLPLNGEYQYSTTGSGTLIYIVDLRHPVLARGLRRARGPGARLRGGPWRRRLLRPRHPGGQRGGRRDLRRGEAGDAGIRAGPGL